MRHSAGNRPVRCVFQHASVLYYPSTAPPVPARGCYHQARAEEKALSKQLRLEIAELTDVGRRRDSNEDNMTRLIPKDPKVLERKGAIFVVADGMGGHAAGEVASEIAVETIRETYYEAESDDIAEILTQATKQANQVIYDRATEQAGRAGMGTTCVTVVVRGPLAYIANVGDSRVYLIREGHIRQLTNDHSWVAEQVRAGMLTDEQARTHAHRNVITRALGTQPTVSADLFIERLQDGDRVLLCSDGLHGYVDEAEIERTVQADMDPDGIAQNLINMANDNGGPDNITAILVHLLEVPQATGEVRLPEDVVGEEQIITQPIPAMPRLAPTQPATSGANGATRPDSASPAPNKLPRVPSSKRKRPNPVAVAAIRMLAVAALLIVSAGIWDFSFGPYALARAAATQTQADIQQARRAAQQAQTQPPNQALAALAQARQR